jgi:hypothetical protein
MLEQQDKKLQVPELILALTGRQAQVDPPRDRRRISLGPRPGLLRGTQPAHANRRGPRRLVANMASYAISSSLILVIHDNMIIGTNLIVVACVCRHF